MRCFLLRRKNCPLLILVFLSVFLTIYVFYTQQIDVKNSYLLSLNNIKSDNNEKPVKAYKNLKNIFYFIESPGYTLNEKCRDGIELRQYATLSDKKENTQADFAVYLGHVPERTSRPEAKYTAVFEMESEWHSNGDTWSRADFRMWYNLDASFPEPATYFDARSFLVDLLSPPLVEYAQKSSTKIFE